MNPRKAIAIVFVLIFAMLSYNIPIYAENGGSEPNNGIKNYVNVNGEKIYYERTGNEKSQHTMLFIHGALVNHEPMEPLASQFKDYNTIVFDLPGHGRSEGSPRTTVSGYADVVKAFIAELRKTGEITDSITLLGWSMGGSISLELAEQNLPEIKNVVLLSSSAKWDIQAPPGFDPNAPLDLRPLIFSELTSSTPQNIKEYVYTHYDSYMASDAACISDLMACIGYDKMSELTKINVPVLIESGDQDHLAKYQFANQMKSLIPKSYLSMHPNRGHFLLIEIPKTIESDIRDFFEYSK